MPLCTPFTEMFGLAHPLGVAPMGDVTGGALAAAVSNTGGLGLVGGGYGDHDWLDRELRLVAELADRPWGVGLITWHTSPDTVARVLGYRPAAVLLSFGDPTPYAEAVKAEGARLVCQVTDVTDVAEARQARHAGADVIVAQGTEAGGHGGRRTLLSLLPAVLDAVAPTPVLAAGGIADGRGFAAVLALGAAGALLGTRFYATPEALGHPEVKRALLDAGEGQTERTSVFDVARDLDWPAGY
ncbi:MAG: nitronate monooxygenase, partial [Sciscionella sp.]